MITAVDIRKQHIVFLRAAEPAAAIKELTAAAFTASLVRDPAAFAAALVERERLDSTGFGREAALPHAPRPDIADLFLMVGLAAAPIPWNALDHQPVRAVFLIGQPAAPAAAETANSRYLHLVSELMLLVKDAQRRRALFAAQTPAAALRILTTAT